MTLPRRIVVDVDGTLYDTKPVFVRQMALRHGLVLEPAQINEWDFWKGRISLPEFIELIGQGLHSEAEILGAPPYPGAVAALSAWHDAGVWMDVASDRAELAVALTGRWLREQGIPFDHLICAPALDKVAHAQASGAGLIIDDKPATIRAALAAGIRTATIIHPYNLAEAALPGVTAASTWPELQRQIETIFA